MINHPEEIKPIPRWTEEEIEMAEKDSYRFDYVARNRGGKLRLWEHKSTRSETLGIWYRTYDRYLDISESEYPSLQPGECVSLEEIAGGK